MVTFQQYIVDIALQRLFEQDPSFLWLSFKYGICIRVGTVKLRSLILLNEK